MAYCPNCRATIAKEAEDCDVCGTSFGSDTWFPIETQPGEGQRSRRRRLFRYGWLLALLPLVGLAWLAGSYGMIGYVALAFMSLAILWGWRLHQRH